MDSDKIDQNLADMVLRYRQSSTNDEASYLSAALLSKKLLTISKLLTTNRV